MIGIIGQDFVGNAVYQKFKNYYDVLTYDLFFGESNPAELIETDLSEDNYDVTVISGKTYYWKVDTTDDSGLKTIGQTWMFAVN